jgi:hypothetical protein
MKLGGMYFDEIKKCIFIVTFSVGFIFFNGLVKQRGLLIKPVRKIESHKCKCCWMHSIKAHYIFKMKQ